VEEPKFGDGSLEDASLGSTLPRMLEGVLRDLAVPGRLRGVWAGRVDWGGLKVFVEARKSTGTELEGPALDDGLELTDLDGGLIEVSELDPGREVCVPLEVGRIGLSDVKKLDPRFRIAGDDGMFCRVSMVRSDNEGRGFR